MSLLDRLMPSKPAPSAPAPAPVREDKSLGARIGAKTLTEAAEAAPAARPLWEDLIAKPMRFWSAREIQYAIEDLATAAERFQDGEGRFGMVKYSRRRKDDNCEDEKKGKELLLAAVKELRGAANSMKKCADHCDSDY